MDVNALESLFLSKQFTELSSYSSSFDLFKVMGVRSKEHVHSNIIASLLNPSQPHGLGHHFLNSFITKLVDLETATDKKVALSTLIASTDSNVRIDRELANIDIVVEFPVSQFVVGIENKVWASEQDTQISRYQKSLRVRYPNYQSVIIFLTPDGRRPTTTDYQSDVPVYCMSYSNVADILYLVKDQASLTANSFIDQFIQHIEGYMSGSNEVKDLCWQIFNKHEDAYVQMVKNYENCLNIKMTELFKELSTKLKTEPVLLEYSDNLIVTHDSPERKKGIDNHDINVRLKSWPDGLFIKIYKYNWLGVFPFVTSENMNNVEDIAKSFGCFPLQEVKGWENKYYVSRNSNLDNERMILSDGNAMTREEINIALNRVLHHIEEINNALA